MTNDFILLVKLRKLSDSRNMPISRWRIVSWVLGSTSGRVLPQCSSGFSSWGLSVQYDDVRSNDTEKEVSVESGPSPDASNGKLGEKSRRISILKNASDCGEVERHTRVIETQRQMGKFSTCLVTS